MRIDDLLEYLKECIDDEHWFEISPDLAKELYDHISELESENKRLKKEALAGQKAVKAMDEMIGLYNDQEDLEFFESIIERYLKAIK